MNQNDWLPDFAQISAVTNCSNDEFQITNVRNFTYTEDGQDKEGWETITVNPKEITTVWYYVAPLGGIGPLKRLFAHTFLGFEFENGTRLAFSIEARRRVGEEYNPFTDGFSGAYTLIYLWGTLHDFESRRTIFYKQSVDRYKLNIPANEREAFMRVLCTETNDTAHTPRIYHSLTSQCTNKLIKIFQAIHPGLPKWNVYWYLTTLSPNSLAKHKVLDLSSKETISPQS